LVILFLKHLIPLKLSLNLIDKKDSFVRGKPVLYFLTTEGKRQLQMKIVKIKYKNEQSDLTLNDDERRRIMLYFILFVMNTWIKECELPGVSKNDILYSDERPIFEHNNFTISEVEEIIDLAEKEGIIKALKIGNDNRYVLSNTNLRRFFEDLQMPRIRFSVLILGQRTEDSMEGMGFEPMTTCV
jgi:hypothetical protein